VIDEQDEQSLSSRQQAFEKTALIVTPTTRAGWACGTLV